MNLNFNSKEIQQLSAQFTKSFKTGEKRITVVLGHPRSGTTLAMRLMYLAGGMGCRGDLSAEFYEAWIEMYRQCKDSTDKGQHGPLFPEYENKGIFPDQWLGNHSYKNHRNLNLFYLRQLLFGGSANFIKTTQLGFENQLVEPFIDVMRELSDQTDTRLQVVWLMRPIEECAHSLLEKWDTEDLSIMKDDPYPVRKEAVMKIMEKQLLQFRQCYDLDDKIIHYKDLVADPIRNMLLMQPSHFPSIEMVQSIMNRKIK